MAKNFLDEILKEDKKSFFEQKMMYCISRWMK